MALRFKDIVMKKIITCLLAAFGLTTACGQQSYVNADVNGFAELISRPDVVLLDVRTVQEFSENHIPGAICVPNENIGDEDVPQLPDKNALILVYCRSGNRSKQAAEKLARAGYTNVKEFGGIIDWTGPVSAVE